jgi:hypothetical protein
LLRLRAGIDADDRRDNSEDRNRKSHGHFAYILYDHVSDFSTMGSFYAGQGARYAGQGARQANAWVAGGGCLPIGCGGQMSANGS